MNFDRTYYGKGISWDGYVVRININEDDPLTMAYHSGSILIKMDLDDRIGMHGADLGLSFSDRMVSEYAETLGSLRRGDHLRFNSTISSMGDAVHLHHLHTFFIEKLEGHREVEAHAQAGSRYKVKITPHDGHEAVSLPMAEFKDPVDDSPVTEGVPGN